MDLKIQFSESRVGRFIFSDTRMSWLWLAVRLYIGWIWLEAGWAKFGNPAWIGPEAGTAVKGFLTGALAKTGGIYPDVQWWYASFIENFALQHTVLFSYAVTLGEIAVGLGLVLGLLTGVAAFFGTLMSLNFLLAGTASINAVLILSGFLLMLAWRNAGWWGLDRYVLTKIIKHFWST